ncbi:MAG: hypothetical protein NT135_00850 [Candidatus Berkelbacteria bacterium]|nr:hypothetical protein [Candidatus Berkelbacteria bacterium]
MNLGKVRRGTKTEYIQYMFPIPGSYDMRVTNIGNPSPFLRAVLTSNKKWECQTFNVAFSAQSSLPLGPFKSKIDIFYRLKDNSPVRKASIPVFAEIESEVVLEPDVAFFGQLEPNQTVVKSVVLSSTIGEVNLVGLKNPAPEAMDLKAVKIDGAWRLDVQLHNVPSGWYKWVVTIFTDNKDLPSIEMPVFAYIP